MDVTLVWEQTVWGVLDFEEPQEVGGGGGGGGHGHNQWSRAAEGLGKEPEQNSFED